MPDISETGLDTFRPATIERESSKLGPKATEAKNNLIDSVTQEKLQSTSQPSERKFKFPQLKKLHFGAALSLLKYFKKKDIAAVAEKIDFTAVHRNSLLLNVSKSGKIKEASPEHHNCLVLDGRVFLEKNRRHHLGAIQQFVKRKHSIDIREAYVMRSALFALFRDQVVEAIEKVKNSHAHKLPFSVKSSRIKELKMKAVAAPKQKTENKVVIQKKNLRPEEKQKAIDQMKKTKTHERKRKREQFIEEKEKQLEKSLLEAKEMKREKRKEDYKTKKVKKEEVQIKETQSRKNHPVKLRS